MTNHPHPNAPSHHRQSDHYQPQYSDHHSRIRSSTPDPPPYLKQRQGRRNPSFPHTGYGGGASARPRSSSHRDRHPWHDSDPPPRSYRNDPYPHQTHNPIRPTPRSPKYPNNAYTGGDPYASHNRLPRREPPIRPPPDTPTSAQNSHPLPHKSRDNSPQHNTHLTPTSGPLKPIYTALSPVKPLHRPLPRLKPATSPFNPVKSPAPSTASSSTNPIRPAAAHDKHDYSNLPNSSALTSNEHPQIERRPHRTLSCEKPARPADARLPNPDAPRRKSTPTPFAIAHPDGGPSQPLPDIPRRNQQPDPNGSLPPPNHSSNQTDTRDRSRSHEQVQAIFKKVPSRVSSRVPSRVPEVPDEAMLKAYTPDGIQKVDANGTQLKEQSDRSEHPPQKVNKPPRLRLRSVPVQSRSCTPDDTPQRRAAVAAMERAGQEEDTETKLQNDCNGINGNASPNCLTLDDPYHSKAQSTLNPSENRVLQSKNNLTSSMAKMNIVDRKRNGSNGSNGSTSERVRSQQVMNNEDNRLERPDQQRQTRFTRGGNRGTRLAKRRTTDFDESGETGAKRPRVSLPPETVNVDDITVSRRSKRLPPFIHENKKWETIGFEEDRVCALFLSQLQNQPTLLRISFLGMADGDLRTTLDIWKGGMDLPEPKERRLEVNNNRIRRVTDYICTRIAALRVVSLNLSCNLLTTIGGKIGVCSRLRFLDVSRNQLASLPQELCDLTSLEVLNLSRNQITRLPLGLCRLKRLEVLSLAWNQLEVLPEDVTAEGAVLTDLDLSHNEKFHFFPRCAEHWTKLEALHMTSTTIHSKISRRELRLRPAALVKVLAGRKEDMFSNKRTGLRSHSS